MQIYSFVNTSNQYIFLRTLWNVGQFRTEIYKWLQFVKSSTPRDYLRSSVAHNINYVWAKILKYVK